MLKSKVSSENYYLHDFGAQTSSNISEHELIYGFELINNYAQGSVNIFSHLVFEWKNRDLWKGADNDFIIVACGLSGKDVASVQVSPEITKTEQNIEK